MKEWSNKQHGAFGRLRHQRGEYPYTHGCVFTPHGIVAVYYEPRSKAGKPYVSLDSVLDGRHFNRVLRQELTERGLVTVAHRFARDLLLRRDEQKKGGA